MHFLDLFKKKPVKKEPPFIPFKEVTTDDGDYKSFEKKILNHSIIMLITGRRGSGKTALGMRFLEAYLKKTKKKTFAIGFKDAKLPRKIKGTDSLQNVSNNAVVLIDEGAITFSSRESMKDKNKELSKTLAVARHKNLSLILIVQNSAMIDLNVLRLIDTLILKEPSLLQSDFERAPIKKIYTQVKPKFKDLDNKHKHFYVWDDDYRGMLSYNLPDFWSEKISKSFKNF